MSTRYALIVNERNRWKYGELLEEVFRLYRHYDGYPEGMGQDLKTICARYQKDSERKSWSQYLLEKLSALCNYEMEPPSAVHGDLEFLYRIDVDACEMTVSCYVIGWDEEYAEAMHRDPVFQETFGDNERPVFR